MVTEFAFVENLSWLIDTDFYFLGCKHEPVWLSDRNHFLLISEVK